MIVLTFIILGIFIVFVILKNGKIAKERKQQEIEREKKYNPFYEGTPTHPREYRNKIMKRLPISYVADNNVLFRKNVKYYFDGYRNNNFYLQFNNPYLVTGNLDGKWYSGEFTKKKCGNEVLIKISISGERGNPSHFELKFVGTRYDDDFFLKGEKGEIWSTMSQQQFLEVCSDKTEEQEGSDANDTLFPGYKDEDLIEFARLTLPDVDDYSTEDLCFYFALYNNNVSYCKQMISNGYEINKSGQNIVFPLEFACLMKNKKMIEFLFENGANPYIEDIHGQGAIQVLAMDGEIECLELFQKYKVDLNHIYSCNEGSSALFIATAYNQIDFCKKLIQLGADLNQTMESGISAIMVAAGKGYFDLVKFFYEQGAILENSKQSSFIVACQADNIEIAAYLLENGCNLNFSDIDGTALHNAIRENKKKAVEFLINAGIDQEILNSEGKKAIDIANENGFNEIRNLLSPVQNIGFKLTNETQTKLVICLYKIKTNHGKEIFFDSFKLYNLLSDYLGKERDLLLYMKKVLESNFLIEFQNCEKISEEEQKKAKIILQEKRGLSLSESENIVSLFSDVLME